MSGRYTTSMDECSGKRVVGGALSRKGSSIGTRDTSSNSDRNTQLCSRIGCSGRPNSLKGTQMIGLEKAKSSTPSFRISSNSKEKIGACSRVCSAINSPKKPLAESRRRLTARVEVDSSDTSTVMDDSEISDLASSGKIQSGHCPGSKSTGASSITSSEEGSSSVSSNTRSKKNSHQKSGSTNSESRVGLSLSSAHRNTGNGRLVLKSFKCNSVADVVASGCLSSESNASKKKELMKKRNCNGEGSSSTVEKKMPGRQVEGQNPIPSHGISISDSRQTRNRPTSRDNDISSIRSRESFINYTRARVSRQESRNSLLTHTPQSNTSIDQSDPNIFCQFSLEASSCYGLPGSSNSHMQGARPASPAEVGSSHSLINWESLRRNMDPEVLQALDSIEQHDELTYEFLFLETSLFRNRLNFYDQHREMRLDIDHMSYEELLALEERMGSVSTALTEDALSTCLETLIYQSSPRGDATTGCAGDDNDIKCSVCQEEYIVGSELGKLSCEHRYHVSCIQQWLRLKNWCPICKAPVSASST